MLNLNIELRDLIRRLIQNEFEEIYGIACFVSDVREEEKEGWVCDCTPINKKATIRAVRLKAESDGGLLVTPSDGSVVFVTQESDDEAFVSMYGKIDSVQFFDGEKGGLINIADLVSRLNELEALHGQLQADFNGWVVAPSDGGLALKTVLGLGYLLEPVPETAVEDIEDERITH